MDDYSINSLIDSKNEWCARLVFTLQTSINQGIISIFNEAVKLCDENGESDKYLMTFQNLLGQIPKWNSNIVDVECKRIEESTHCKYLEDMITCVHVIHLKALTCIRTGLKQKKVDIDIPNLNKFIHQVYINLARKLYTNVYLFEKNLMPLEIQKNNREIELLIRESIMNSVRDNIPVEKILSQYLDETEELPVSVPQFEPDSVVGNENKEPGTSQSNISLTLDESLNAESKNDSLNKSLESTSKVSSTSTSTELTLENKPTNLDVLPTPLIKNVAEALSDSVKKEEAPVLNFSSIDEHIGIDGSSEPVYKSKDVDTLNQISKENNAKRKEEEAEDDDDTLKISDEDIKLDLDIASLDPVTSDNSIQLTDIEILS